MKTAAPPARTEPTQQELVQRFMAGPFNFAAHNITEADRRAQEQDAAARLATIVEQERVAQDAEIERQRAGERAAAEAAAEDERKSPGWAGRMRARNPR